MDHGLRPADPAVDHRLRPADPAVDPGPSRGSQMEEEEEEEGESWCTMSKKVKISVIVVLCALVLAAVALGVVLGVLKLHQTRQLKKWHGEGTTPHFHKKFLKRCYDYTQVLKPELRSAKDCQKIVEAFMDAVLSKDPCRSTEEDYEPLMKLTEQTVPCDKTLFWSGTSELVHQYTKSQPEMFTLENTLLGYMADGLKWCGDAGSSEMNYQSCPDWRKDCARTTMSIFWDTASKRFAGNACGVVQVMLNASRSPIFNENSTFGRVEIHNLNPRKVSILQALVVHNSEEEKSHSSWDSCEDSSIKHLELILRRRGVKFTCQSTSSSRFLPGKATAILPCAGIFPWVLMLIWGGDLW